MRNRMGPMGMGAGSGRGYGNCSDRAGIYSSSHRRRGCNFYWNMNNLACTEEEYKIMLKNECNILEARLKNLKEELSLLSEENA